MGEFEKEGNIELYYGVNRTILNHINLNGKITEAASAAMPIDNGGFRYGLFETMLVQEEFIRMD